MTWAPSFREPPDTAVAPAFGAADATKRLRFMGRSIDLLLSVGEVGEGSLPP
jgi:hypothetical protein